MAQEPASPSPENAGGERVSTFRAVMGAAVTLALAGFAADAGALLCYLLFGIVGPFVKLLTIVGSEIYYRLGWHIGDDLDLVAARVAAILLIAVGLAAIYLAAYFLCSIFRRAPFRRGSVPAAAFTLPLVIGTCKMITLADSMTAVGAIGLLVVAEVAATVAGALAGHRGSPLVKRAK